MDDPIKIDDLGVPTHFVGNPHLTGWFFPSINQLSSYHEGATVWTHSHIDSIQNQWLPYRRSIIKIIGWCPLVTGYPGWLLQKNPHENYFP